MSDLGDIMDAMAGQLATQLGPVIEGLQVDGRLVWNPTPPSIDIYPSSPFQEQLGMGVGNNAIFLLVRARVATPDHEGAQELLLSMMDPNASTSVAQALDADPTFGGVVDNSAVGPPTDFGAFIDPGGGGALLGCTWQVEVLP